MTDILTDPLVAADPRHSAWVSANAGAGKTHTLANRVTRLLLDGARPERILCLTYTKAAAAEMQTRLFEQLGKWAMLDDELLSSSIAAIGAAATGPEALRQARRLFAMALETPGGLRIQTIHSFCQYLLARFPMEANVPPSFRVLEEQTAREMLAEARTKVLERAGSGDERLAAAAAHLVTETSEWRLNQILDAALGADRRKLERFFNELPEGSGALSEALEKSHGALRGKSAQQIRESFCAQVKREAEDLPKVVEWLRGGGKEDAKIATQLHAFVESDFDPSAFGSLRSAFCTKDGDAKDRLATKALSTAQPALFQYLTNFAERFLAAEKHCRAARAASLAEASLTLADAVRQVYAQEKRSTGALDYDDLITATLNLLGKAEAAAWVLYKLDGGLDHILIDEAQDTSPEQWQIVRKLTEEFFAGEGARDLFSTPRTIFAVGDEKQSIFSFQGADPDAFERNRQHFRNQIGECFADVRLETSRRSTPEVLAFVDAVFTGAEAYKGLTSTNAPIHHEPLRKEALGRVEFWQALKPADSPDPDLWKLRPIDVEAADSPVVRLADQVAKQIRSWLANRVVLPGHEVPIRPGDIMILMPRREPFASEIIRRLAQYGVPVAGADRIRLKNEIAVMDLMALGRFVLLPEDDLNLAALLRSPLIDVSEDELFSLANQRKGTLWHELRDRRDELPVFASAAEFLTTMMGLADFRPPHEFFADVLFARGMRARLLARLGPEARDAIDELLSLSLHYESTGTPSLEGFLHWIGRGDTEIRRDMEHGRNEVRVMTVHGAKGLEADIVILPDTTTLPDPPGRRGELLYDEDGVIFPIRNPDACDAVRAAKEAAAMKDLEEHRRLLYVALTRAKERLYICGFENKKGVREGSWYQLAERAAQSLGNRVNRGDKTILTFGDAEERSGAAEASEHAPLSVPDWACTPPAAIPRKPRLIRPSDDLADTVTVLSPTGAGADNFRRGLLVHTLLARLPEIEPAQRHNIALSFLAARGQAPDDAKIIVDQTLRVIGDPHFAPAFATDSRAEVPVVADLPEIGEGVRVSGRIDRLALTDRQVLAIDFKTNRKPPERIEDIPSAYLRQMALYRLALAKIFPGRPIACALVWTEGPRLTALPESLLEAHLPAKNTSLDAA